METKVFTLDKTILKILYIHITGNLLKLFVRKALDGFIFLEQKFPLMQFEKYAERMNYFHELVSKGSTGTPKQFATKLGISERMLYRYIEVIKQTHRPISFCRRKKSYVYSELT
jgi:hypothetical protein